MVMDHLNDFQKDLPETAYLTADVILIQPLHDYEAMMVSTLSDKCRKDAKIYSLGTIYTRYRNYCKFKNDFQNRLLGLHRVVICVMILSRERYSSTMIFSQWMKFIQHT